MEYSNDPSSAWLAAFLAAIIIPSIIIWVITVIGLWKVYEKAGKPGWAAIIPIYNIIVLIEIVGKPIWWIFLLLVPCANIVIGIWLHNLLSKSFGKGEGFTIGLLLLPFIFFPVLGFGSAVYIGPAGAGPGQYNPNTDPFNTPPQV